MCFGCGIGSVARERFEPILCLRCSIDRCQPTDDWRKKPSRLRLHTACRSTSCPRVRPDTAAWREYEDPAELLQHIGLVAERRPRANSLTCPREPSCEQIHTPPSRPHRSLPTFEGGRHLLSTSLVNPSGSPSKISPPMPSEGNVLAEAESAKFRYTEVRVADLGKSLAKLSTQGQPNEVKSPASMAAPISPMTFSCGSTVSGTLYGPVGACRGTMT